MKNNRKKQTSSYLLIFLGIVAALLILIILYLTFFRKDSQSSINLAKNDSALSNFYGKILYIKTLQYAVDFYAFYHCSFLNWAFCSRG